MIVDAHLHIWRSTPNYHSPGETIVSPFSDVPVELLSDYMEEHGVDRAVLVQPLYPGEDNSYVANCAATEPEKFAAVCVVDPRKPDAVDRLEYWVKQRGCKGLRLRPLMQGEGDIFGDPTTYPLWESAETLGVVINILAGPKHIPTIRDLAERFSGVQTSIDHMAHPNVDDGVQSAAFQSLLDLARFPHVFVKVTGYYYYSRQRYPYPDCWDLFRALYDCFGPSRLIWGSDFPHVLLATGYRRSIFMQERVYPFLSRDDLTLIMGQNAAGLYWGK